MYLFLYQFPIGKGKMYEAQKKLAIMMYQFPIGKGKNNILYSLIALYTIYRDLSIEKAKIT